MNNIPFLAVGNGELDGNKRLKKNALINCPHCLKSHRVKLGKNEDGEETNTLMFYTCGKKSYLCGIDGVSLGKE